MILTWFVEHIKSLRKDINSLPKGNWWQYLVLQTTVENLKIQVLWWVLMNHWCALSKFWKLQRKKDEWTWFESSSLINLWLFSYNLINQQIKCRCVTLSKKKEHKKLKPKMNKEMLSQIKSRLFLVFINADPKFLKEETNGWSLEMWRI